MANTRLSQDLCATKKYLDQSTGEFKYMMYPGKYANCSKCRIELGSGASAGNQVSLYQGNLVDLESDLRGQTRPASLCPSQHYKPDCSCKNCAAGLPCGCLDCQQKMLNQPSCQMVRYPPTVQPPQFKMESCNYSQ